VVSLKQGLQITTTPFPFHRCTSEHSAPSSRKEKEKKEEEKIRLRILFRGHTQAPVLE
jgi:hypothetical protein